MKITTAIVLDTRRPLDPVKGVAEFKAKRKRLTDDLKLIEQRSGKDSKEYQTKTHQLKILQSDLLYPVKLRVTQQGKQRYYGVEKFSSKQTDLLLNVFALTQADFDKAMGEKPREKNKDRFLLLNEIEQRARKIIDDLPSFTFEIFEKHFSTPGRDVDSVYAAYENYIAKLKAAGSVGTAISYECSRNSIRKVMQRSRLSFSDVTVDFLDQYAEKMTEAGNSSTTISMYVRCLRTLFNEAIATGLVKRELYPFGKYRFNIPPSDLTDKALTFSDIQKLIQYKAQEGTTEQWALDMWLFSYLCSGINIKDIALLKFSSIQDESISFSRAKTKNARGSKKVSDIEMHPLMKQIIERWGSRKEGPDSYVFGILSPGLTPMQELRNVQQAVKTINKYMKRIATSLGIQTPCTTYSARHSYATVSINMGAPIAYVSKQLRHASIKTTEKHYVGNSEREERRKWSTKLTDFSPEPLKAVK